MGLPGMSDCPTEVSAIIVCYNEEKNIRRCLDSLKWCDEIVVVDSFSTDSTLTICREYTDKITQRAWRGHGDQKAFAHSLATKEWVLSLDADEWLSRSLQERIRDILRETPKEVHAYRMPLLCYYLDRWWWRGGWYPDYKRRLFRRERATWGGVAHEKVIVPGDERKLRELFFHFPYDDITDHLRRINYYTTINAKSLWKHGRRSSGCALILRPLARFLYGYCLRRAFLESTAGLFFAFTGAFYVFVRYLKLRELGIRDSV